MHAHENTGYVLLLCDRKHQLLNKRAGTTSTLEVVDGCAVFKPQCSTTTCDLPHICCDKSNTLSFQISMPSGTQHATHDVARSIAYTKPSTSAERSHYRNTSQCDSCNSWNSDELCSVGSAAGLPEVLLRRRRRHVHCSQQPQRVRSHRRQSCSQHGLHQGP